MVDLIFQESAAGALQFAKHRGEGKREVQQRDIFRKHRKETFFHHHHCREKLRVGAAEDVFPLTLALDIGDLSDMEKGMAKRRELLKWLFDFYPQSCWEALCETNRRTLNRLQVAKNRGEAVRLWIGVNTPNDWCGLYWLSHFLQGSQSPLLFIKCPSLLIKRNVVVSFRGIEEMTPEQLLQFENKGRRLSQTECRYYAGLWREIQRENAPLRVLVNGKVTGVPEDFYDFALRKNIPEGEFATAELLGKTLSELSGVGDGWLYRRIEKMIRAGELQENVPATPDHPYSARLHKERLG